MRLRNIPGADEAIAESPYCINEPETQKGNWQQLFGNDNPIHIEIGMGKGQFLTRLAKENPHINYIGIERYSSVLLRALQKMEQEPLSNLRFLCIDAASITEIFEKNGANFRAEAEILLKQAASIGIPEGEHSAVFHEGFAYFAELFRMENVFSVFADEYQMPSAKELTEAAEEAKGHGIHFFLTADDSGRIYGKTLAAEVDEKIVLLDPLTTAEEENLSYMERMEKNIEAVEKHWKEVTK